MRKTWGRFTEVVRESSTKGPICVRLCGVISRQQLACHSYRYSARLLKQRNGARTAPTHTWNQYQKLERMKTEFRSSFRFDESIVGARINKHAEEKFRHHQLKSSNFWLLFSSGNRCCCCCYFRSCRFTSHCFVRFICDDTEQWWWWLLLLLLRLLEPHSELLWTTLQAHKPLARSSDYNLHFHMTYKIHVLPTLVCKEERAYTRLITYSCLGLPCKKCISFSLV